MMMMRKTVSYFLLCQYSTLIEEIDSEECVSQEFTKYANKIQFTKARCDMKSFIRDNLQKIKG